MNKIIFIGLAFFMLGSMGAKAQTNDEDPFNPITFVDANGNTVADGSHLRVSAAEDVWGGVQASTGLYVNNTSEDEVMTAMKVDVDSMDNGDISCCFPMVCTTTAQMGWHFTTKPDLISGSATMVSIQTEWLPESSTSYGAAKANLTVCYYETKTNDSGRKIAGDLIGYGPSVSVTFVNEDPTGINNAKLSGDSSEVSAIYNLNGKKISNMGHGINIVRLNDGTVRKIVK